MNSIDAYKEIGMTSEVMGASPWQLIKLMLDKLNQDILAAMIAMKHDNIEQKCKKLTSAHDIVSYLQECLDFEVDNVFAQHLGDIYAHLKNTIFWSNAKNDMSQLEEAKTIIENLGVWWSNVNH